MTGREWGLMGVLAILWGVSFFFSKVALAELPPFTLVLGRFGIAALALTSGLASILNATTPLFTALVAHAWGDERLTSNRVTGVLVGLAGAS